MSWQQYRKIAVQNIKRDGFFDMPKMVPEVKPSAQQKNRCMAKEKIRELREYDPLQKVLVRKAVRAGISMGDILQSGQAEQSSRSKKLHSSVSLPVFSAARLRHGAQLHKKTFRYHWLYKYRRPASESEILLACLMLLVGKLKRREGLLRRAVGPRFRMYNEDVYSYETVAVYVERGLWLALQARALELEVSLSYLADLAVRLYLNFVLRQLSERQLVLRQLVRRAVHMPQDSSWKKALEVVGVDYVRKLLRVVSYQKIPLLTKYSHPPWGRPGAFSLQLNYCFGLKSP